MYKTEKSSDTLDGAGEGWGPWHLDLHSFPLGHCTSGNPGSTGLCILGGRLPPSRLHGHQHSQHQVLDQRPELHYLAPCLTQERPVVLTELKPT